METAVLYGVGKTMRIAYLNGKESDENLVSTFQKNKREADAFSPYGYHNWELVREIKKSPNPLLKKKIENILSVRRSGRHGFATQDETNLRKLEAFKKDACGVGLRSVIKYMRKLARKGDDSEARLVLMMLETEYANLSAKQYQNSVKRTIYDRKTILITDMAGLLKELGWRHGVTDAVGKKANFIVYVYLPNGVQLSWHVNDYHVYGLYPGIDVSWDGQVCMNMEKILKYIDSRYMHSDTMRPSAAESPK